MADFAKWVMAAEYDSSEFQRGEFIHAYQQNLLENSTREVPCVLLGNRSSQRRPSSYLPLQAITELAAGLCNPRTKFVVKPVVFA